MKIEIKLKPFVVPSYVSSDRPGHPLGPVSFPSKDLSAEALNQLCDRFRQDVFEKAGKKP